MKCKKVITEECDGCRLRDFLHSLPYREVDSMRVRIAEACGVGETTVLKWTYPSSYRRSFTSLQKAAINKAAGHKIF